MQVGTNFVDFLPVVKPFQRQLSRLRSSPNSVFLPGLPSAPEPFEAIISLIVPLRNMTAPKGLIRYAYNVVCIWVVVDVVFIDYCDGRCYYSNCTLRARAIW
jgi:hypothetical protein